MNVILNATNAMVLMKTIVLNVMMDNFLIKQLISVMMDVALLNL